MSIKHTGTSIFLNAENHKAIPVREQSQKRTLLSLLFCLPSAFHKGSLSTSGPGVLALGWRTVVELSKDTAAGRHESGRHKPSLQGTRLPTASFLLPQLIPLSSAVTGRDLRNPHDVPSEVTESHAYKMDMVLLWVIQEGEWKQLQCPNERSFG